MLYLILAMFFKEVSHFCPEGAHIRECDASIPIYIISFRIRTYHIRIVILRKKEVQLPLTIIEINVIRNFGVFFLKNYHILAH